MPRTKAEKLSAQPRNFSCKIFDQIIHGIKLQNQKIALANYLSSKVKIISDSSVMNPKVINISTLPDSYIDSIVRVSDFPKIEDDPLFHNSARNIVIDKLIFFTKDCNCVSSSNSYEIIHKLNFSEYPSAKIIELKSILIAKEHFVVSLQSRSSKSNVLFYFKISSNQVSLDKMDVLKEE